MSRRYGAASSPFLSASPLETNRGDRGFHTGDNPHVSGQPPDSQRDRGSIVRRNEIAEPLLSLRES